MFPRGKAEVAVKTGYNRILSGISWRMQKSHRTSQLDIYSHGWNFLGSNFLQSNKLRPSEDYYSRNQLYSREATEGGYINIYNGNEEVGCFLPGHGSSAEAPPAHKVPAVHGKATLGDGHMLPASHSRSSVLPSGQYIPVLHGTCVSVVLQ